ncbi:MAG: precorrin-3B C(17)-methyltransferase [Nitrospirota bacterium]
MRQSRYNYSKGKKGECNISDSKGRVYVVGIGPGGPDHITPAATKAIKDADIIVGYKTYLDLIQDLITDKEVMSSGMRQEVDRCAKAVELAQSGKTVAVICSGDPGIYAMAGLVFEVLSRQQSAVSGQLNDPPLTKGGQGGVIVEIIPGIPALSACASRLGAPLMHDFASISLSDLLTPWELIEKRLEAAAYADFVIVIYNPKSKGRPDHIAKAREIILKHRSPDTPVGIVKGATRENETVAVTDLQNMLNQEIDMQSTVIIGNSNTFIWNDRMVTPRGYDRKYKI